MKHIIVIILLLPASFTAYSQKSDTLANQLYFNTSEDIRDIEKDHWLMRFGVLLGSNFTSDYLKDAGKRLGFSIGIAVEYRITNKLSLCTNPLVSILTYKTDGARLENAIFETPVHLLIKPFKTKYKPVISFGPNYKFHLFQPVPAAPSPGLAADIGIGVEKQYKYFTIFPQLRYSYAVNFQTCYFMITFY